MTYTVEIEEPGTASVAAALPAYELGGELGRGGFGVVLAARHRQLGRLVAVKQLPRAFGADPGVRSRFVAEARVLATLDHPHVVEIYDFVDYEGVCLLVMERLTGGTVWSRFHAGGFGPDVSCALLLAVLAGLHHAHAHGVLHRDVKPENLMFNGDGTLKVTDLGVAKVVGGGSTLASRIGEVLGTPAYLAPEQARGGDLSPATDVYQAGTVLFELLAGRLPFPLDCDAATILYRHVHEAPPPLGEVAHHIPARLAMVTDRAIATSPADRYQSAEEFAVAIATGAASIWGPGWLARTKVPVSVSGPVLAAALGEVAPSTRVSVPTAIESAPPRVPAAPTVVVAAARRAYEVRTDTGDNGAEPSSSRPVEDAVASTDHQTSLVAPPRVSHSRLRRSRGRSRRGRFIMFAAAGVVVLAAIAAVPFAGKGRADRATPHASHPATLTSAAWRVLPASPTARQQMASTVWNGVAWLFGGLVDSRATTKVEGYDPVISQWESGPDLPVALHHEVAVVYRGEIVVIGGWIPNGRVLDSIASNRVFALRKSAWVELPRLLHARAASGAAVVGDKIVVAGGQANHQLVAQTEVFDGTRWTDVAPMPTLRDHLAGVSDGRYFYAVGGRALSADKNLGAVERFDPVTNGWTKLPGLPTPRGGLGAAIVGTRLVTVGGERPNRVLNTVEALDLDTNTWSKLPPMVTPRHGLAVVSIGAAVYAIDGAGAPGDTHSLATNEALDMSGFPATSRRVSLPAAPAPRQQVVAMVPPATSCVHRDEPALQGCSERAARTPTTSNATIPTTATTIAPSTTTTVSTTTTTPQTSTTSSTTTSTTTTVPSS